MNDCFRSHFTHTVLEGNDRKSPKYLAFDHVILGDNRIDKQVITFAAYNEKKTDMSYEEYIAFDKLGEMGC